MWRPSGLVVRVAVATRCGAYPRLRAVRLRCGGYCAGAWVRPARGEGVMARVRGPSTCRSCGAEVLWVVMESGKPKPVDVNPDPTGNVCVVLDRGTGERIGWIAREGDVARRHHSHFRTCPHAATWRARRHAKPNKGMGQGSLF